jgi:Ca-activated chloride channel family protein
VLPILITILIIGGVLAVVYFVGAQPSDRSIKKLRPGQRSGPGSKTTRQKARPGRQRSRFQQPPVWVRKLPLILLIGAVASLVVALAQFRIAKSQATPVIVLVIDASNSMDATDVQPNRLAAAESAAQGFLQQLPPDFAVALVSFADAPQELAAPTNNHELVSQAVTDPPRGKGTVIGDGLSRALDEIEGEWAATGQGPAAIVLLSDGNDTGSEVAPDDAASRAASLEVPVYTVILGSSEGGGAADVDLLTRIAQTTGAQVATAETSNELSNIYDLLGSQLSSELTISSSAQLFVFLAIALAMAAALILLILTLRKQS